MTEALLALYLAGFGMCLLYLYRGNRFQVHLPLHEVDSWQSHVATGIARVAISTYWVPFLILEAMVERRRKEFM